MPRFELDPPADPIIQLPPLATHVEIYLELAKAEAGCIACQRPIPAGVSRIAVRFRVPTGPTPNAKTEKRTSYAHVGCLVRPMGQEVKRRGNDCWDCGKPKGIFRCYTTRRYATSRLCGDCAEKSRWRRCGNCSLYYPHQMVWRGAIDEDATPPSEPPNQTEGEWCDFCALRWKVKTSESLKEDMASYEQIRKKIIQGGIFE